MPRADCESEAVAKPRQTGGQAKKVSNVFSVQILVYCVIDGDYLCELGVDVESATAVIDGEEGLIFLNALSKFGGGDGGMGLKKNSTPAKKQGPPFKKTRAAL